LSEPVAAPKPPRRKRTWFLAGTAALLLVLVGGLLFLFYSDPGRRTLSRLISKALSMEGLTVRLEELGPGFPRRLRLARFTVADDQGTMLSGSGVRISWQPWALLQKRLVVSDLFLDKLVVHRAWRPEGKKAQTEKPPGRFPLRVSVRHLEVNRLTVERPVLGLTEDKAFSISGAAQMAGATMSTALKVAALDGSADRLNVQGQWDADKTWMAVDAVLEEAPGGLLGRLLNLPEQTALRAELSGRGPLHDLNGRVSLSASRTVAASADFTADLGNMSTPSLRLNGLVRLDPKFRMPKQVEDLVGREATVALEGHLRPDRVLILDSLRIETPELKASSRFSLNLGSLAMNGALTLNVVDFKRKALALAGLKVGEGGRLDCRLAGSLREPRLYVTTRLSQASYDGVALSSIRLATDLGLTAPVSAGFKGVTARGDMVLEGLQRPALGQNGEPLTVSFQMRSQAFRRLVFSRLQLNGHLGEVSGQGTLDLSDLAVKVQAEAQLNDLGRLPALAAQGLSARALVALRLEGFLKEPRLDFDFSGRLLEPSGLPRYATVLTGPVVSFEGLGQMQGRRLAIQRFTAQGGAVFDLSGAIVLNQRRLDLAWTLEAPAFLRGWGVEARAPVRTQGTLSGNFDRFKVEAESRCQAVRVWDEEIRDVRARVEAADLPARAQGRIEVTALAGARTLQAEARAALSPDRISLTDLRLSAPGAEFQGQAALLRPSGLVEGRGLIQARDLSQLGEQFGHRLSGNGEVEVVLHPDQGRQQASFKARMQKVCVGQACLQSLRMDLKADSLRDLGGVQISAVLERLRLGRLNLGHVDVQGLRDGSNLRFTAKGKGRYVRPFELTLSGAWRLAEPDRPLVVESAKGAYDRQPVQLLRPMVLDLDGDNFTLSGLDLMLGAGRLTGQAARHGETVGAEFQLLQLPLEAMKAFLPIPLSGQISGSLTLNGQLSEPRLEGVLEVVNFQPAQAVNMRPLQMKMTLLLNQGQLTAEAELTDRIGPPGKARIVVPVSFSLRPYSLVVQRDRPVSGSLKTTLDLALLAHLLALEDQAVSGPARIDLALTGTARDPLLSGQASLEHGYYEHLRLGVLLYNISLQLRAKGQEIVLTDLKATDGQKGRVTGRGWVRLDHARDILYSLELDLHQAQVVHSDLVTASGDGRLAFEGTRRGAKLAGTVTFQPTELVLPQHLGGSVPEVKIKEVNAGLVIHVPSLESEQPRFVLAFDLSAKFPGRFHVRGRGLDATWKGAMRLTGNLSAPKLTGGLTLVRGRFVLLGKSFQLTQGGLTFDGQIPPSPYLDVTGESQQKSVSVIARLSGPISALRIDLESEPPLPQDEILSHLLFGRSMAEVSPLQALQLAKAAAELFGVYAWNDPGLFSRIRQTFGVDVVGLRQTDTGGTAVELGANPVENVYIQAEKDVDAAGYSISVEIELSPHFLLETDLNPITGSGFGLYWKYDY